MTPIPLPFARDEDDRVIAGVCAGIAKELDVDPTLVRLVFAVLALAGGAGIGLYLALWAWADGRRPILVITVAAVATMALLLALGFSPGIIIGLGLMLGGAILLLREAVRSRVPGIVLVMAGAVVVLQHLGSHSGTVLAPGALAGALLLVLGPWVWRLTAERSERIRLAERAEIAARIHDSVLQTLALVQRDARTIPHACARSRAGRNASSAAGSTAAGSATQRRSPTR